MATNARETGPLSEAVAAELRALLGLRKWKQVDLSNATGIPKATLSSLLGARTVIDIEQLALMARALGVDPGTALSDAWDRIQLGHADDVYLPDGSLNPANIRGFEPTEEDIDNLFRSRRPPNASNPG